MGNSLTDTVKTLAKKYNLTTRALYRDYEVRKQWIPYLLGMQDNETFLQQYFFNHQRFMEMAVKEYLQADNSNARVGALRLLRDFNNDFYDRHSLQEAYSRLAAIQKKFQTYKIGGDNQ